ncbi:hypothetical protein CBR_g48134 [Chara braunii]|uniref:Uncharacterized protein n=1 Tax=Chara braunii TaxID=69332 RepID=A0A388M212_CHABU|nr:hypothetical protein CBR_g48134 [Chara braunii]|eukprot:GBG88604.1 hypothetical protein CBR_g48134 [Chara braunii]
MAAAPEAMASAEEFQHRANAWLVALEDTQRRMQRIVGVLSSVAQAWPVADWGGSALVVWLEDKCQQLSTLLWEIEEDPELEDFVDWQQADALIFGCNTVFGEGIDYRDVLKKRLETEARLDFNPLIPSSGESTSLDTLSPSTTTSTIMMGGAFAITVLSNMPPATATTVSIMTTDSSATMKSSTAGQAAEEVESARTVHGDNRQLEGKDPEVALVLSPDIPSFSSRPPLISSLSFVHLCTAHVTLTVMHLCTAHVIFTVRNNTNHDPCSAKAVAHLPLLFSVGVPGQRRGREEGFGGQLGMRDRYPWGSEHGQWMRDGVG